MPKKKPLKISKEFVEQVMAIISNESEEGARKQIAIARRAEKKYGKPVKSWLTGWFYQYTRTRGEEIEQSINVMEKGYPDAYTRLKKIKRMVSGGEWNVNSSWNYFYFLELSNEVPGYEPLEDYLLPTFIMELKDEVMIEINSFITQYDITANDKNAREIEQEAARQKALQAVGNVMVFNNLVAAKNAQSEQHDKIVFSLGYHNNQWHLSWVDARGEVYPLTPGEELRLKLATLRERDVEKLSPVLLRQIKRECIKAREEYLAKIQLIINPEHPKTHSALTNEDLKLRGITSTFVLRNRQGEISLWWLNTMGVPNKISLTDYPKLDSWLTTHKDEFTDADLLQLKAYLLQLNTAQSIDTSKLNELQKRLSHIFKKRPEVSTGKINLKQFAIIEQLMMARIEKTASEKQESQLEVVEETTPETNPNAASLSDVLQKKTEVGKINLKQFAIIEEYLGERLEKKATEQPVSKQEVVEETTPEAKPKKLEASRYAALSQLPNFWQQHKIAEEKAVKSEAQSLGRL